LFVLPSSWLPGDCLREVEEGEEKEEEEQYLFE